MNIEILIAAAEAAAKTVGEVVADILAARAAASDLDRVRLDSALLSLRISNASDFAALDARLAAAENV